MSKGPVLTQRLVEDVTCPPGRKDMLIFDADLSGFGLRVTSAGSKIFLAQFHTATSKRRVKIGAFGALTVSEARKRAKVLLGAVADGRDPVAERRATDEAQRQEKIALAARAAEAAFTFGRMVNDWATAREDDLRASYIKIAKAALKRHFAAWLDWPASRITKGEVRRALSDIKEITGKTAANRALAYGRAVYSWAVDADLVVANPLHGLKALSAEVSRDRVLGVEELASIWRASAKLTGNYGPFVRVLLLTLQRRDEVAGMRWDELSADLSTWTIPSRRAKNGRAHLVHLAEPVRAIIAPLPRIIGCPFVFSSENSRSENGSPVSAYSATKQTLDTEIAKERAEASQEPASLPRWTLHDFRRAGVTALACMGFAPHVCDRLLNHVTGSINGVAAVYQRAEFLTERKAALDAWAAHVMSAAEERAEAGNVVSLVRTI